MVNGFIAVHTGAGNCLDEVKYSVVCKEACRIGTEVLKSDGTALDACEAAITCLENSGETNAGYGSNLTWDGKIECEASIMDGVSLKYGACTNVTNIWNPIKLAKVLCERQGQLLKMSRIPPIILCGDGATSYAEEFKIPIVDPIKLFSKKSTKLYDHYRKRIESFEIFDRIKLTPMDTVGAVCLDENGNIAAGCSSGGFILKIPGRIGQAATYGAGCWAMTKPNLIAGTCTTGNGEYLMKTLLAKEIIDGVLKTDCPVQSLHETFKDKFLESPFLATLDEIYGGALTVVFDKSTGNGEILWSHTTKTFCLGYMSTLKKSPKFILSTMPNNLTVGKATTIKAEHFKLPV